MSALGRFSDADLEEIRRAVAAAERRTAGEIVPYIVESCAEYPEARWRSAVAGSTAALVVTALAWALGIGPMADRWGALWSVPPDLLPLVLGLLPALVGVLIGLCVCDLSSFVRRGLIGPAALDRSVALRAEAAFLEEEVFDTRERTGVLVFLALFEHRAVVLGDAGINQNVEAGRWRALADELARGVRAGREKAALVEAIRQCGELLEEREVERRDDDADELPDHPRLRER